MNQREQIAILSRVFCLAAILGLTPGDARPHLVRAVCAYRPRSHGLLRSWAIGQPAIVT